MRILQALSLAILLTGLLASVCIMQVEAGDTIYIRSDGSIEGTDKIHHDEGTYTLSDDITGSIIVERNNIIIDGSGHVIQGPGALIKDSIGIYLAHTTNVTIRNMHVMAFFIGIWLYYSSDNQIVENNLTECRNTIMLNASFNNTIVGNTIDNNKHVFTGIWLHRSSNNHVTENTILDNNDGIWLHESSSNTISHNKIMGNYRGISEHDCNGNRIFQNNMANNNLGVWLDNSTCNSIFSNSITSSIEDGILLDSSSSHNNITANNITNNEYAIIISNSSNNSIYHNNFSTNTKQVHAENSSNLWNSDYPSGGNYWTDHNPTDEDLDRIGDLPYIIDENNFDQYPLIYPYGFVPKPDVNSDGTVNILDIATLAAAFGCEPGDERWNPMTDMDMNEIVNIIDIADVARNFG